MPYNPLDWAIERNIMCHAVDLMGWRYFAYYHEFPCDPLDSRYAWDIMFVGVDVVERATLDNAAYIPGGWLQHSNSILYEYLTRKITDAHFNEKGEFLPELLVPRLKDRATDIEERLRQWKDS